MDFVSSIILDSAYGLGIALVALVLFCWQGSIYLLAGIIAPYLTAGMLAEISILGGVFLMSSALEILKLQDCKTLNMLPTLLVAPLLLQLVQLLAGYL